MAVSQREATDAVSKPERTSIMSRADLRGVSVHRHCKSGALKGAFDLQSSSPIIFLSPAALHPFISEFLRSTQYPIFASTKIHFQKSRTMFLPELT